MGAETAECHQQDDTPDPDSSAAWKALRMRWSLGDDPSVCPT